MLSPDITALVPEILPEHEARARGYSILAGPYGPTEEWMLYNAIATLERGARHFVLIQEQGQPDGWHSLGIKWIGRAEPTAEEAL